MKPCPSCRQLQQSRRARATSLLIYPQPSTWARVSATEYVLFAENSGTGLFGSYDFDQIEGFEFLAVTDLPSAHGGNSTSSRFGLFDEGQFIIEDTPSG